MLENVSPELLATALPAGWALKKLLGPTLDAAGLDLAKTYQVGVANITSAAVRKVTNINDGAKTNLRVTRDVFWNGAFSEEAICAEYFGGILASSRSQDGKDDTGVFFVDLIKSLSSKQLNFHYVIYRSLNLQLLSDIQNAGLNVGQASELMKNKIFFSVQELTILGLDVNDLFALHSKGVIGEFKIDVHQEGVTGFLYSYVVPTTLGVQLFAVANNFLKEWRTFPSRDFGSFPDIGLPVLTGSSIEAVMKKGGWIK